jgi:Tol biopolymer transport system component
MAGRGAALVTAAAVGAIVATTSGESAPTLLTVPQRDRLRSTLTPASASISADGRYIAFTSYDRLTAEDDDQRADVYVLDRTTGRVALHSARADDVPIDSDCSHPRISGNGRFVAFDTSAMARDGTRSGSQVVVHDRMDGSARTVSRRGMMDPNGWSGHASIADDGMTIAYTSTATNVAGGGDVNGVQADVILFRPGSEQIERVSLDSRGRQSAHGSSFDPALSGDGRYVAFTSTADLDGTAAVLRANPVGRQGPMSHVYLRDLRSRVTTRVDRAGVRPDGASMTPAISRDGRFVAFASLASNLVAGDRNRSPDVFLFDRDAATITLVSRSGAGRPANGSSGHPAISADGRFVAFQSDASDLSCGSRCADGRDINLLPDVFLFDRTTRTVTHLSVSAGAPWMEESSAPALDAAGEIVAFSSKHPIDGGDVANDFDLFVRVSR